jgi:hypothetical protein
MLLIRSKIWALGTRARDELVPTRLCSQFDNLSGMPVGKREQVFVSSTFKDLVDERAAVIQTLLEADCIPTGMEMFPASDSDKFELIKRVINLCDYYVVIIGGRYGSVDAEMQLSYTEMEYDYAVEMKKPVMAFLHGDPGKLIGEKLDLDPDLRKKLDAFREKTERRMVKYWNEPGDLKRQVALAMIQIRKSHPAEGWIRAGEAMTPEVKAELAELRAKVRELGAELRDDASVRARVCHQRAYHRGMSHWTRTRRRRRPPLPRADPVGSVLLDLPATGLGRRDGPRLVRGPEVQQLSKIFRYGQIS